MQQVEIHVKGQIDPHWADWLGGLEVHYTLNGRTVMNGFLRDQAALYGVISRLSSLGLQLISVKSKNLNNSGREKEGKM